MISLRPETDLFGSEISLAHIKPCRGAGGCEGAVRAAAGQGRPSVGVQRGPQGLQALSIHQHDLTGDWNGGNVV